VTISGSLLVNGLEQVKFLDNGTRAQVPVVADDLNKLSLGLVGCTVGLDEDGQGGSNTNSVRQLDSATTSKLGSNKGASNVSSNVSTRSVDLGEILHRNRKTWVRYFHCHSKRMAGGLACQGLEAHALLNFIVRARNGNQHVLCTTSKRWAPLFPVKQPQPKK
jgi:hypothetical protein